MDAEHSTGHKEKGDVVDKEVAPCEGAKSGAMVHDEQELEKRRQHLAHTLRHIEEPLPASRFQKMQYAQGGMGQALKALTEFFAAVCLGGVRGYTVDRVFHISPFGLILFLFLGAIAGMVNVIRTGSSMWRR